MSLAFVALSLIIQSVHAQDEEANSHDLETTKKMESKNNVMICLSIVGLVLVVSIIWCCVSNSQSTHKEIAHHTVQDHCHISLDVTGNMFDVKKIKFCSQNTNDIKNSLSVLFGLQPLMVEILRPQVISCGLKIIILLYISNEKYEELKVKDIIYEQHKKGRFAIIFNDSWNLSSLPDIDNIICEQIASKQKAKMHDNMAIKVEGPSKIFRSYMDEDIVREINQNIQQTDGIVENYDMGIVESVSVTQIVMEYMDECETNKNAIHEMLSK